MCRYKRLNSACFPRAWAKGLPGECLGRIALPGAPNRSGGMKLSNPQKWRFGKEICRNDPVQLDDTIVFHVNVIEMDKWHVQMLKKIGWTEELNTVFFYLKSKTFLRDFVRKHRCPGGKKSCNIPQLLCSTRGPKAWAEDRRNLEGMEHNLRKVGHFWLKRIQLRLGRMTGGWVWTWDVVWRCKSQIFFLRLKAPLLPENIWIKPHLF